MCRWLLCAGLLLVVTATGLAADISPVRFTTPNGITVLVLEQHFLPIVEIHALIKVGSAQDPAEKAGLANLVSSLLDEGTTTRTSKQLAEQIDFVGGSLGAHAGEDFSTATVRILEKDIDLGFTLLADILQHPMFPKQEFERVRSQILGEISSDNDDPGNVAMKAFNQLVFQNHPYRWPVNGTEETLNASFALAARHDLVRGFAVGRTIHAEPGRAWLAGEITADQAVATMAAT
ncbi:MAG: DUF2090 domain-containing protein, partial [Nitrospira sp.]|nr:DUF2090 domain-containing protein [Nitrospira sp.]